MMIGRIPVYPRGASLDCHAGPTRADAPSAEDQCDHGHMAKVAYVLGAGFNCSVLDPSPRWPAPLARNFFKVLFQSLGRTPPLPIIDKHLPVDALFKVIECYWHLDSDALQETDFDIEECLTFIESRLADRPLDEDV